MSGYCVFMSGSPPSSGRGRDPGECRKLTRSGTAQADYIVAEQLGPQLGYVIGWRVIFSVLGAEKLREGLL